MTTQRFGFESSRLAAVGNVMPNITQPLVRRWLYHALIGWETAMLYYLAGYFTLCGVLVLIFVYLLSGVSNLFHY